MLQTHALIDAYENNYIILQVLQIICFLIYQILLISCMIQLIYQHVHYILPLIFTRNENLKYFKTLLLASKYELFYGATILIIVLVNIFGLNHASYSLFVIDIFQLNGPMLQNYMNASWILIAYLIMFIYLGIVRCLHLNMLGILQSMGSIANSENITFVLPQRLDT